ncbi:MAG: hypothetical protein HYS25_14475 [Ignavibacteriales bacterium]|nr:hypothetical protein [Ignavibacteriales bacterium]
MGKPVIEFLSYVQNLTEDTKPLWGKMTPRHMIEHLILAVKMGNGKIKAECFNPPEKIPTLKRFLQSSRHLPQNFINPIIGDKLLPLEYSSLEEAITVLKNEIDDYETFYVENPEAILTNATFGDLNKEEWDTFHDKHFTHHLKQFGLL